MALLRMLLLLLLFRCRADVMGRADVLSGCVSVPAGHLPQQLLLLEPGLIHLLKQRCVVALQAHEGLVGVDDVCEQLLLLLRESGVGPGMWGRGFGGSTSVGLCARLAAEEGMLGCQPAAAAAPDTTIIPFHVLSQSLAVAAGLLLGCGRAADLLTCCCMGPGCLLAGVRMRHQAKQWVLITHFCMRPSAATASQSDTR